MSIEMQQHMRRLHGISLIEMLVVIGVFAIVLVSVATLVVQNTKLYARTSIHLEPQASEMLGLKRMERDLREAMYVDADTSTSTWLYAVLPQKDESGMNIVVVQADGHLGLPKDATNPFVYYFLGKFDQVSEDGKPIPIPGTVNHYVAQYSTTGDSIFRSTVTPTVTSGGSRRFADATVVIKGVLNPPLISDPQNPGKLKTALLFEYFKYDENLNTSTKTRIVNVTLTTPIPAKQSSSIPADNDIPWKGAWGAGTSYTVNDAVSNDGIAYLCHKDHVSSSGLEPGVGAHWDNNWDRFDQHSLSTQFCLRNLQTGT